MRNRARVQAGTRNPPARDFKGSAVVDVHVDRLGYVDVRCLAESKLSAEEEQKHQHYDDQQDHRQHASAATAAGFDYGRAFALDITVIIIGHGNSPCLACCCCETSR